MSKEELATVDVLASQAYCTLRIKSSNSSNIGAKTLKEYSSETTIDKSQNIRIRKLWKSWTRPTDKRVFEIWKDHTHGSDILRSFTIDTGKETVINEELCNEKDSIIWSFGEQLMPSLAVTILVG